MYLCRICSFKSLTIRKYELHQYLHRNLPGILYYCSRENCNFVLSSYSGFVTHVYRFHTDKSKLKLKESNKCVLKEYTCDVRNCIFISDNEKIFLKHFYSHFKYNVKSNNISLKCPLRTICGNLSNFRNLGSFRSHATRKHLLKETKQLSLDINISNKSEQASASSSNLMEVNDLRVVSVTSDHGENEDVSDLKEVGISHLANMYITLQSKFFLSNITLQTLIDGFSDLNDINTTYVERKLRDQNININNEFLQDNIFHMAHNKKNGILRTHFLRNNYYKNKFHFVKPVKINLKLDSSPENPRDDVGFFYYVPILETLKVLFKNDHICKQFFLFKANKNNVGTIYSDISDGEVYKNNLFFRENPSRSVKLILFQDAFEICNPLGSKKNKYKIIGIYMTLANLSPWNRTQVEQIQLVGLCFEKDVKKFGFSQVLKQIIVDLKKLESKGIFVSLNDDEQHVIKGSVVAVAGDNLGSHQIGGFLETFNTTSFFCRYCYVKSFNETNYLHVDSLRTKESYDFDVTMACTGNTSYNGVKNNSALNFLKYFHVANPGLPPCLAHDILEGIAAYDLMLCINQFVKDKILNYQYLNDKYKGMYVNKKKIFVSSFAKNKEKVAGSASEILCILNTLPVALFEKITILENCKVWEMLLCLRKIVSIVIAFKISIDQVSVLKDLIEQYIEMRIKNFPDTPLRPKHHFLLHYPFLIRKFGPLRHLWTLRFESKHKYFKNIIRHCPNFKNVLKTLSFKHQYLQAYNSTNQKDLYSNKAKGKCFEPFFIQHYPDYWKYLIPEEYINRITAVTEEIHYRGIDYRKGGLVCFKKDEFSVYSICFITYILCDNSLENIYFLGKLKKIYYDSLSGLYYEYPFLKNNDWVVDVFISFADLICSEPLMDFQIENYKVFYFKSAPVEYF